jgi:PQQ-like domain/Bacterial Ig-like domain (group 2)
VVGSSSCGGDTATGPATVESVTIEASGDTLLLPTQQVLLIASPRDSRGRILTDHTIQWSSSNPSIATVAQTGWVTAVSPGTVTIGATSEDKAATVRLRVQPVPVAAVRIAIQGDSVIEDGSTRLLIAVALDSAGGTLSGRAFTWSSSDNAVATVSTNGLVRGIWTGTARIRASSEGRSDSVALRVIPRVVASVTVATGGFDALYAPDDSLALSVTLKAANGDTLDRTSRPVTWSSSNQAVATVTARGVVIGQSAGPVTITASREGQSGFVNLAVLLAPAASWGTASDWGTFQADPQRTGHIAATGDPRTFHTLWTRAVAPGVPLSPAVTDNGRVFVATESYFGTQLLVGLTDATGQPLWTVDFGPIHGVHQPAVGNGRVYVTTSGHSDAFLYAFDAASGTRAFRTQYGCQWERYYAPIVTADAVYFAGGTYGGMYRYDATSGASDWFFQTNQYDGWTPAMRDSVVYSYTGDYAPKVTANSASTGALLYEIPDSSFAWNGWTMNTAPVLSGTDNLLAIHDSRLVAFDLAAHRVRWERRSAYTGMVSVIGDVLYAVNGDMVEARTVSDGALRWSWTLPPGSGPALPALALTDNLLFVSTSLRTYALDLQGHTAVWSYPAGGRLSIGSQGVLYIAQATGTLSAVALK